MSKQKPSRGSVILFFGVLTTIGTGLILHGLGFRLSLVLGVSMLMFAFSAVIFGQLIREAA